MNSLEPNGIPPHELVLAIGMPIVLLRNLSPSQGLCNGTRLCIEELNMLVIKAKILNGTHVGEVAAIPRVNLELTQSNLPFTLCRRQFPIRVAFAMTINKSQGQTINHVGLYLPSPVFSHGQLYVALSRCPRFENLHILIDHGPNSNYTANIVYDEMLD